MAFATAKEWRSSWKDTWGKFRDEPATRDAMAQFDALKGSEHHRMRTLMRIMPACLSARECAKSVKAQKKKAYKIELDPGQKYRDENAAQKKVVHRLAAAAQVLAKACERNDRAMLWALPGGVNDLGVALQRPHDGKETPICEMGAAWFNELKNKLSGKLPELHGGPFYHRFTLGNMHFENPLAAGRPVELASMLAFELAFYLRMFTAGRAGDSTQNAQTMPNDGKPCTPVVAAFCSAALGEPFSAREITARLSKLPKSVGLIGWPK